MQTIPLRAVQARRQRRRVLDGRLCRQAEGDLRACRPLWRAGSGRRLPRDRASRREGTGHAELTGAGDRVDIVTGAFGKTLAAAWAASSPRNSRSSISWPTRAALSLFQFARASARRGSAQALEIAIGADGRRALLKNHARRFREGVEKAGFTVVPGETPIIPVMLGEAQRAQDLARALDERGLFVAGFFFPVVPKGQARIRTQMSAALTEADIDFAIGVFEEAGRALGIV